jgi:hypothetical protein
MQRQHDQVHVKRARTEGYLSEAAQGVAEGEATERGAEPWNDPAPSRRCGTRPQT